jgi:hypothetical protein
MRGVLIVFAKAPRPGAVKTRLTPALSYEEAAELYAAMLGDVLETSSRAARANDLETVCAVHPAAACSEVARLAPPGVRCVAQRGGDLAARMAHAASEAAAGAADPILIRGSDSPALGAPVVAAAVAALARADVVFCPDRDGGYQLVALRRPAAGLFDAPTSTPYVLADSLERARARGLRTALLEPGFDIDVVEDLALLEAARAATSSLPCPRTLALLDERGLWSRAPRREAARACGSA